MRMDLKNEKKNVERLSAELERLRQCVEEMKEKENSDVRSNSFSAVSTISSSRCDVLALAEEYNAGQKVHLGKFIRHQIFKTDKVTNKRSFEDGSLQKMCHRMMGHRFESNEMLAAYKESFMKLVNSELGQKRSQVNQALLKRWKGTYDDMLAL